jgi:hypothetical protein
MNKKYKDLFMRCQGNCRICFDEGGCSLENKIKKIGIQKVKKEVYNE